MLGVRYLFQNGLQPRQYIIGHIVRHILHETRPTCAIIDGARLVAHDNDLLFFVPVFITVTANPAKRA